MQAIGTVRSFWGLATCGALVLVAAGASAAQITWGGMGSASSFHSIAEPAVVSLEEGSAQQTKDDQPVVTFSGLHVHQDGSSTFRVQLTEETPVEFSQDKKTLRFLLRGARVTLRTNRYPLRAEYFGSNVLRTKLDNEKAGATLEIQLRSQAIPQHSMLTHAGGATLSIQIPAASSD